ncbi:hypothetical protein ACET3Z_030444 [Daucus carota]
MSLVSPKFTTQAFVDKLTNGIVMVFLGHYQQPWTGTIVGARANETIILTVAHCLNVPGMTVDAASQIVTVKFNGNKIIYPAQVVVRLMDSEIMLLRVNRKTELAHKFRFAPKNQHALKKYQPVATCAHPSGHLYQTSEGTICSEEFQNPNMGGGLDKNMIFFHHRMDLRPGCSGASIFNEYGNIIGLQSGGYATDVSVIPADSLEGHLSKMEKDFKLKASLTDELEHASTRFAGGSFRPEDRVRLRVPLSDLQITVHVKYMDYILRTKVFQNRQDPLDKLIEEKYILGHGVESSSSYGVGSSSSERHPGR